MSVVRADHQQTSRFRPGRLAAIAVVVLGAALPGPASAQGLFDFLFGGFRRPPPPPSGYSSPPDQPTSPRGSAPSAPRYSGGSSVFCVRLCDGRYFPLRTHAGSTPAQMCSAFCPAAQTSIFRGGNIEYSVGPDGGRYSALKTAFIYRERLVPDCTCNGRDPFGLAQININTDTTLRQGDIVATTGGFMAFTGTPGRAGQGEFTPVQDFRGLGAELKGQLSDTKVTPPHVTPPPKPAAPPGSTDMGSPDRRAQISR